MRSLAPWAAPAMLLGSVAAYLMACTFVFPATPILLGGDQTYFWTYADRMWRGERIYRDFFQFTPPGTDLVFLGAFALLGARIWVTNAVVIALGVALAGLCFCTASRLASRSLSALATALFVVFVYGKALNATHHWFGMLAIMGAVWVVRPDSQARRFAAAGALLGLGSFFTQSHGVVALLAFTVFVAWQARREKLARRALRDRYVSLFGAFAVALLSASAYFIVTIGIEKMWSFQVAYVWRHMPCDSWRNLGLAERPTLRRLPALAPYFCVYSALPIVYAVGLRHCWRDLRRVDSERWTTLALSCLVGTSLLVEVASHISWLRLFSVALPASAVLAWLFNEAGKLRRPLVGMAWLGVAGAGMQHIHSMHSHNSLPVDLPAGAASTDPIHREKLEWLAHRLPAGDFLFAADWPIVYLPLRLVSPVFVDVVGSTEETRPEYVERAIAELEARRVRFALWPARLDDAIAADDGAGAGVAALRAYIHSSYRLVRVFSDDTQVWERIVGTGERPAS